MSTEPRGIMAEEDPLRPGTPREKLVCPAFTRELIRSFKRCKSIFLKKAINMRPCFSRVIRHSLTCQIFGQPHEPKPDAAIAFSRQLRFLDRIKIKCDHIIKHAQRVRKDFPDLLIRMHFRHVDRGQITDYCISRHIIKRHATALQAFTSKGRIRRVLTDLSA